MILQVSRAACRDVDSRTTTPRTIVQLQKPAALKRPSARLAQGTPLPGSRPKWTLSAFCDASRLDNQNAMRCTSVLPLLTWVGECSWQSSFTAPRRQLRRSDHKPFGLTVPWHRHGSSHRLYSLRFVRSSVPLSVGDKVISPRKAPGKDATIRNKRRPYLSLSNRFILHAGGGTNHGDDHTVKLSVNFAATLLHPTCRSLVVRYQIAAPESESGLFH